MGFRENLRQKLRIDESAAAVVRSMGAPGSGQRIDMQTMRQLVELGAYTYQRERDLDLYLMPQAGGQPLILVLDNELKIYATDIDDVALRKSPTVTEMVSIRNAIKILNDKDVVLTRKAETVKRIAQDLISALDLTYTTADIEALASDGRDALERNYIDGLMEVLDLFAELLGFDKAPKPFQAAHHIIWARKRQKEPGEFELGPMVALDLMHTSLKMIPGPLSSRDKASLTRFQLLLKDEKQAHVSGAAVFEALADALLEACKPSPGTESAALPGL